MHQTASVSSQCEVASAAFGLIVETTDREALVVTQEQRPNTTMANQEHVAFAISPKHMLDLFHDARLSINRPLPAAPITLPS